MAEAGIWEKPISHGEILKTIWKNLDLGTLDRHHPFHTPVFGTIADGGQPSLRIVVLRRFWRRPARLAFHAHAGSPEIEQLRANPNVYWLFFHPEDRFQVRIKDRATFYTDGELPEEQWLSTES
jgi:pyridoxamine 5'-phosphate oxidase